MPSPDNLSRGIIRSMLITGGAQVIGIALSILRMKVLAVLLGPAGIGLLSIYNSLAGTVGTVAGLGLGSSGVREIAAAKGDPVAVARVRRVLFGANLLQGAVALAVVWIFRERLALWLFDDAARATQVGLVGVAVLLSLIAGSQTTLLQGLRRIGDLGRVTVFGALAMTVVGLTMVWALGMDGLIWFVLAQPFFGILVAWHFTRRLRRPEGPPPGLAQVGPIWLSLARLGAVFMLGGLMTSTVLLLVRGRIATDLGLDASGQFAAAWGITMVYVGFLLGAMGADYYPRLTEVIRDAPAAHRLMNQQAQISLALGGPVLLALIGLAPWAVTLLYSDAFEEAAVLLQWQTLGNVFKLTSWSMSFAVVAAARPVAYFFMEASFNVVFLALVWLLLPVYGLWITGVAFLLGYVVYFGCAYLSVRRLHGFSFERLTLRLMELHMGLGAALLVLARNAPVTAAILAIVLAIATAVIGSRVVLTAIGPQGRLAGRIHAIYARLRWPLRSA